MEPALAKPVGGRRVPRPTSVEPCSDCGEALGASYSDCPKCHTAIESIWLADWAALLDREGIQAGSSDEKLLAQVVLTEYGQHSWTVMDIAMSLLCCEACGGELGEHYPTCGPCGIAFGSSIASEFDATRNEHALHVGRWVLRYPNTHSANAVKAWRMSVPRLLTGWLPTTAEAQRSMMLIKAGRMKEIEQQVRELDDSIQQSIKPFTE